MPTLPSLCTRCGFLGYPTRIVPGSNLIGCALLVLFIIPGLIYAIWQQTAVYDGCPKCKAPGMIPSDSPQAKQYLPSSRRERPCPSCAEPILAEAKKCKHCGEDVTPEMY